MLEYIYFVKCPGCEDEHFDFFNDAKDFAIGCLSKKPIITQIEVDRNDFGECTDSCDLGTIWSWEEMMETDDTPAKSVFTKDDLKRMAIGQDPEFDNVDNSLDFDSVEDAIDFLVSDEEEAIAGYEKAEAAIEAIGAGNKKEILDTLDHIKVEEEEHIEELKAVCERKPVPEGMTIEQLVEEMEENEDDIECKSCHELFDKSECMHDRDYGWLCSRCQRAIEDHGASVVISEPSLEESYDSDSKVELEYKNMTATITTRVIPATRWDPEEYEEEEVTKDFIYRVDASEIADVIWGNFISEDDAKSVTGGLATLEDEDEWQAFLNNNFDKLVRKYYSTLLEYYREDAEEAAEAEFQDDYDDAQNDGPDPDAEYDSWYNESCPRQPVTEKMDPRDLVELEYPSLTVTLYGAKRDVDDWDEVEHTDSHVFLVPKIEIATAIWENWITEEDVKDVEGGLAALEADDAWEKFLETNFDDLFEKYNKQIFDYFEEEATEDFRERSQEEYQLDQLYDNSDQAYDELRDSRLFREGKEKPFLEEFDSAEDHKARLTDCPECGSVSYDMKEQYCTNCGLNL